ncbi:MAG: hypothetical protein GY703_03630 [Gammaproteobacteria bacterium]|nr:hypothetical protein [Gammaproteobacteria bacterium]
MKINPFFPVLIVLLGVVIYAYYSLEKKPDPAVTVTPRQYIEMVEKNKEQRRANLENPTMDQPTPVR